MKTKFLLLLMFSSVCLFSQIKTQNIPSAQEATVFILPQNVIPNGKIISHGPPNPKKRGKTYLIHFDDGIVYVIKTAMIMNQSSKGQVVETTYKIVDEVSTEIAQDLTIAINYDSPTEGMKMMNINGVVNGDDEWDITFEAHAKHDLKNSYFLDFVEEKGFEVVLDMKQQ